MSTSEHMSTSVRRLSGSHKIFMGHDGIKSSLTLTLTLNITKDDKLVQPIKKIIGSKARTVTTTARMMLIQSANQRFIDVNYC
jgi:hypothetical protein